MAEVLSDYPDVPLVAYMPNLSLARRGRRSRPTSTPSASWSCRPTEVLVGNHKTLTDFLLPDWDSERPASPRELAVAAAEHGTRFVLVTGVHAAAKGTEQFIDNVLASPQGALTGEKFERFEASFVGAGDTLSAALAALLAAGSELQAAVGEALAFLDQSLDAGFRPGMGNVRARPLLLGAAAGRGEARTAPRRGRPTTPSAAKQPRGMSTDAAPCPRR